MILYSLHCAAGHSFDEWFANSAEYDSRKADESLICPECGDTHVTKAIMAPSIGGKSAPQAPACPPQGCGACAFSQH